MFGFLAVTVTLKVAARLLSSERLNWVTLSPSIEYLGSFGLKTRNRIPMVMPIATISISRRLMVQHRNLQQQLLDLLFFGGGWGCSTTCTARSFTGTAVSDFDMSLGKSGAEGVCGDASTSWTG